MLIAVNFHYIREHFNLPFPSIFGSNPDAFRNQLKTLSQWGEFVSQNDILASLTNKTPLPEKSFIVTFDDGLKEQYELALPILRDLGIPAIFFVNPRVFEEEHVLGVHKIHQLRSVVAPDILKNKAEQFILSHHGTQELGAYEVKAIAHYKYDEAEIAKLKYLLNFVLSIEEREALIDRAFKDTFGTEKEINKTLYMNLDQLKEIHELGYLGSHSYDHFPIGTLQGEEQDYQIRKSQDFFIRELGQPLKSFSYPYGAFEACNGLQNLLMENEFQFAFTMERAVNSSIQNSFYLSRFDNNDMPLGKAWKGPLQDPFEAFHRAQWKFT